MYKLTLSKKGYPCLWESGGGMSNTGSSVIICDKNDNPKFPIYIKRSGQLSCGGHALIPVVVGDMVVEAHHHRGDFNITINEIIKIDIENLEAETIIINIFDNNEWDKEELASMFLGSINAATNKAKDYHCRSPYYILKNEV